MPISILPDRSKGLTTIKVSGVLTFDKAMSMVQSLYEGEPTANVLCDLTETAEIHLTADQVIGLASYSPRYKGFRPPGKTAIVVHQDLFFGLSRMFESHSEIRNAPYQVRVFRNTEEAMQWIEALEQKG